MVSKLGKRSKKSTRRPSTYFLKKIVIDEGVSSSILSMIKNIQTDIEQKIEKYNKTMEIIDQNHIKKIKRQQEIYSKYLLKTAQPEIHKTPPLKKRQTLLTEHQSRAALMIKKLEDQTKIVRLALEHLKHEVCNLTSIYEEVIYFEKHWFNDIKTEKRAV